MHRDQLVQVDVEELVAVHGEDRAARGALLRSEADPAAAAERLRLLDGDDLDSKAREVALEVLPLAGGARDDQPVDARPAQTRHLVREERPACDRDERLRLSLRRGAEAFRLAACEDDRLHQNGSVPLTTRSAKPRGSSRAM
jgi:hypothetical protein